MITEDDGLLRGVLCAECGSEIVVHEGHTYCDWCDDPNPQLVVAENACTEMYDEDHPARGGAP